jgi:hypothetical protein
MRPCAHAPPCRRSSSGDGLAEEARAAEPTAGTAPPCRTTPALARVLHGPLAAGSRGQCPPCSIASRFGPPCPITGSLRRQPPSPASNALRPARISGRHHTSPLSSDAMRSAPHPSPATCLAAPLAAALRAAYSTAGPKS